MRFTCKAEAEALLEVFLGSNLCSYRKLKGLKFSSKSGIWNRENYGMLEDQTAGGNILFLPYSLQFCTVQFILRSHLIK